MESYESEQIVCGHHVYKNVWTPFIGEFSWVQVAPVASCHLRPCSPSCIMPCAPERDDSN